MDNLSAGAKAAIIIGSLVTIAAIGYGVYYFTSSHGVARLEDVPGNAQIVTEGPKPAEPVKVIAGSSGINKESFSKQPAPFLEKRRKT